MASNDTFKGEFRTMPMTKLIEEKVLSASMYFFMEAFYAIGLIHLQVTLYEVLPDTDAAASKSLQSCPILCDPIDGSPQVRPSLGFSRQEYWSGLPFPSPLHSTIILEIKNHAYLVFFFVCYH